MFLISHQKPLNKLALHLLQEAQEPKGSFDVNAEG